MSRVFSVISFVIESLFFGGLAIFVIWVALNNGPVGVRIGALTVMAVIIGGALITTDKIIGGERH